MDAANDNELPRSRAEAKKLGVNKFFTGTQCKRGHVMPRFTSDGSCSECRRIVGREWAKSNPDAAKAIERRWMERNPEKNLERSRKSYAKNRQKRLESGREWREQNPDYQKVWRSKNPESGRRATLKWQAANPNKVRAAIHNYRAIRKNADGIHTAKDIQGILERQKFKCAECKASIKKRASRHVDHIMPLSKGGGNGKDNLQILCVKCNLQKSNKHPLDFAQERGRLV